MRFYKRKGKQILCLLMCIIILVANVPIQTYAAVNPLKYIYAEHQAFVPSLGETTTVTWNLQNKHPINIYIMSGEEIVTTLVENEEFKGGYIPHETIWDGKDSDGNDVPAGTYQVVVEPQDKYIKHKSITEVYVVDDLTKDINMLPNLEGNSYLIYGNSGKKKGVNSVSLSITENGKNLADIFTAEVTVSDHIWYARLPMSAYKLYRYVATINGSSAGTKSMSAIRHIFRVVDRMEYLASFYYADYLKDAQILNDNHLPLGVFNRGSLVGESLLVKNPDKKLEQDILENETTVYQHLGLIDVLAGTTPNSESHLNMGNHFYANLDLSIDGHNPLFFQRMYNSMSGGLNEFGLNWSFTFSYLLHDMKDLISIAFEDGHIEYYVKQEDGSYQTPEGLSRTLVKHADETYTLTVEGTRNLHFTNSGRIVRVEDVNGQKTDFKYYDGLLIKASNTSGTFYFEYNPDGTISSIKDSGDRSISYEYKNGLLTGYTDVLGNTITYGYDAKNRLTTVTSAEGIILEEVTYDNFNRVVERTSTGSTFKYIYDDTNRTIQCTEPSGNVITYYYTEENQILKEVDSEGEITYFYQEETEPDKVESSQALSDTITLVAGQENLYAEELTLFSIHGDIDIGDATNGILTLKTSNYNSSVAVGNTLYPNFLLTNTSNADILLSDVIMRYYYTADGTMPPIFWSDWAGRRDGYQMIAITEHITGKFIKLNSPIANADCYVEVGFDGNAGTIKPGETVEVKTRVTKQNWENFNTENDYSMNSFEQEYTIFHQVDVFYKGQHVWGDGLNGDGTEITNTIPTPTVIPTPELPATPTPVPTGAPTPEPTETPTPELTGAPIPTSIPTTTPRPPVVTPTSTPTPTPFVPKGKNRLKMQMYNAGTTKSQTSTIQPMINLMNEASNMVKLSDVTIRYYYTMEEEKPQIFTCDWSSVGTGAVTGSFHQLEEKFQGADSYVEIDFTDEAGYIGIGETVNIHFRIYKEDFSSYDPTDDFSMNPTEESIDWDKVDIYIRGEKVWGKDLIPADEEEPEDRIDYADTTYTPLRVEMYNRDRENRTNTISPRFRIYNIGIEDIKLSDISLDYFYTTDGPEEQQFSVDWIGIGNRFSKRVSGQDVTCQFSEVDALNLATYCIAEIGFTRDDIFLSSGEYIELQIRINRPNWTDYVQYNDFSFNAESQDFEEWIKIAAFVGERWVYGSMPLSYAELTDPNPEEKKEQKIDSKSTHTKTTDKAGNTSSYTYDENGNITSFTDALGNVTKQTYNEWNMVTSVTDAMGNTVNYSYDDKGNITKVTDAMGNRTEYSYSNEGYVTKVVRPDGSTVSAEYDSRGNITEIIDGNGAITKYAYDILNHVTEYIDANGNVTKLAYTPDGKISQITNALGDTYSVEYNKDGKVIKETDEKGSVTSYEYSRETGLLTNVVDALGRSVSYTYDTSGRLSSITDPVGATTCYEYDLSGRLIKETDALNNRISYEYDKNGNLVTLTDAMEGVIEFSYDPLGRLLKETDALGGVTTFEYDAIGRLLKEIDAEGNEASYEYDKNGNLKKAKDALGYSIQYSYNALGLIEEIVNQLGYRTIFEYDREGRLIKQIDAEGGIFLKEYDPVGNLVKKTDPNGNSTVYAYDKLNQLVEVTDALFNTSFFTYEERGYVTKVTDALGNVTQYARDLAGNIMEVTDALGNRKVYEYDKNGNITKRTDSLGHSIQYRYNQLGLQTEFIDELGSKTSYSYDRAGRLIKQTDAEGRILLNEYDLNGTLIKTTDGNGNNTAYAYDKLGRLVSVTDAIGNTSTFTYDKRGFLTKVTDACGNSVSYAYDAAGNTIQEIDALGNTTSYQYHKNGQLAEVMDALFNTSCYEYDPVGNLIAETRLGRTADRNQKTFYAYDGNRNWITETDPFGGILRYEYDAIGRLSQKTEKDGSTISYQYDPLGNIKETTYSGGDSIWYAYDKESRLISVSSKNSVTSFEYDAAGRVTKTTDENGRAIGYSFTKTGQKESILYPDGSRTEYEYDKARNLIKVGNIPAGGTDTEETVYSYDRRGLITEKLLPNHVKTEYTYDAAGRILAQKETCPYGMEEITSYAYDKNGNLIQETKESSHMADPRLTTYAYDALSQLVSVSDPYGERTYVYDEFGNRIRKTENGASTSYTYNQLNQLLEERRNHGSSQNITTYAYDRRGNVIEEVDTGVSQPTENKITKTVYEFDPANQLVRAEKEGVISEYQYDGLYNRIRSTVTEYGVITGDIEYAVDQMTPYGDIIATYDNLTGEEVIFTYGAGLISVRKKDMATLKDTLRYYQLDIRSSVTGLYDEYGTLTTEIDYDEYGILQKESTTAVDGNIFSYTSHVFEESTGLYYAKARYYESVTGRFLSEDIYRGSMASPISRNRYAYVWNNPINYVDLSGENPLSIKAIATVAAAAAAAVIIVAYLTSGMKAYDVGSKLYKDGIAISALLIEALENLSVFPNTIAEIKRGYEESRKQQEEALKQAWSVVYQDGNNPGPYPFPADPSQETSETLIPPEVSGYEDIEIFPANQNLLNDSILSTPSSEFKNDLYGRINGFPILQRDMKDTILYSKGGSSSNLFNRTATKTSELTQAPFNGLKNNGIIKVNTSGTNRPLTSTPNSYYSTANGEHVFVYDGNGKLIYDLSAKRVKAFKINVNPAGKEFYQEFKLDGAVPDFIKNMFGW